MDQTEICNLALLRLGYTERIANIADTDTISRLCASVYEPCVRTMLRERPWPFAVRQVELALVGQQIFGDWAYTYRYPSGYIHIHMIRQATATGLVYLGASTPAESGRQTDPFAVGSDSSGRLIHTDTEGAQAVGTVYVSDTTQYDPMFASSLAWFIASELAISITKSRDLYAIAYQQYQDVASSAFASAMDEPKPRETDDCDLVRARY